MPLPLPGQPKELKIVKEDGTLKEQAFQTIKNAILTRRMVPGVLYSEPELSQIIKMSRTPVREALQQLSVHGMVEFIPRKGFCVRSFSEAEVKELFDFRCELECVALKIGFSDITDDVRGVLTGFMNDEMKSIESDDISESIMINTRFHDYISRSTGNRYFIDTITSIRDMIAVAQAGISLDRERLNEAALEHADIIRAILDQDLATASERMAAHIIKAKELVLSIKIEREKALGF